MKHTIILKSGYAFTIHADEASIYDHHMGAGPFLRVRGLKPGSTSVESIKPSEVAAILRDGTA